MSPLPDPVVVNVQTSCHKMSKHRGFVTPAEGNPPSELGSEPDTGLEHLASVEGNTSPQER